MSLILDIPHLLLSTKFWGASFLLSDKSVPNEWFQWNIPTTDTSLDSPSPMPRCHYTNIPWLDHPIHSFLFPLLVICHLYLPLHFHSTAHSVLSIGSYAMNVEFYPPALSHWLITNTHYLLNCSINHTAISWANKYHTFLQLLVVIITSIISGSLDKVL